MNVHSLGEKTYFIYSTIMFYPNSYEQQISNEVSEKETENITELSKENSSLIFKLGIDLIEVLRNIDSILFILEHIRFVN